MSTDARRVREALAEPAKVAELLGLLEGSKRQAGGGLLVRCPSHGADRHPSCSLTATETGLRVRCFACPLAGDVLHLLAAVLGLDVKRDFRTVYVKACELAGLESNTPKEGDGSTSPRTAPQPSPPQRVAAGAPPARPDTFAAIASHVLALAPLGVAGASADVAAYLEGRGLLELAIGAGWGALPVDSRELVSQLRDRFGPAEVAASGLIRRDRLAYPEHRLCIPWRNPDGTIGTLQRRAADDRPSERYVLPSGRSPRHPFGVEALASAQDDIPIAWVEGAADVLALRDRAARRGRPVVALGLPGVAGWRREWATLGKGRRCYVATDADPAGDDVAALMAPALLAAGALEVRRVRPPEPFKDWCEALAGG